MVLTMSTARASKGFFPDWQLDPTAPWALYTAAAVAIPSIVPYTLAVMLPSTVGPLLEEATKPGFLSTEEIRSLIARWAHENNVRQVFGLVGTLAGLVATILR
jgi:hypothetical protein